jgi:beta-aspartyl-dipeptidase (metallo-type)
MNSIREDVMFIDEVIGAGEVAVSDERGLNQSAQELAKMVRDTNVGGHLTGKAGVTHFHVGEEDTRLAPLFDIIEDFQVKPEWLYPTHVQRNARLLREAIDLANAGAHVDIDVVNEDLGKWLDFYVENGGPLDKLTISSDTDSSTPDIYWEQLCGLVIKHGHTLDFVLPLVTTNPARVLKLDKKGCLEAGKDADLVILSRDTLEIRDVIARGKRMVADGTPVVREKFLSKSSRSIDLVGEQFNGEVATKR